MSEYKTRCELHFTTTYTEGILNGTDPVLKDELVPITIENNGTVKKADLESEWYSYANKNWANAVILEDQYDTLNTQGSVHGATKQDGYVSFDGVDDYINLGLENYEFTNGVTFSINFSLNSIDKNSYLLGNWEQAGGGIYMLASGVLRAEFFIEGSYQRLEAQTSLELGEEYQAVFVFEDSRLALYLNDELVEVKNISYENIKSPVPITIGANFQASGNHTAYTNADVKQVQIYNRAISEEEVTALNEGRVLNSEGLLKYVDFTNKSYEENEIIPEEAIESYFVWIPKYRYQLWDLGQYDSLTAIDESKVHEIPIIFGDYNTSDSVDGECTTPMTSGASGACQVGDYMTHPAFLSIPSTGFWVGKFETGYNGATSTVEAQQNVNDSSKVIIKPNVYSWRGIQVANAFNTSYNYQRDLDSHMMKNTEWGAVAYLQHSAYGSATSVRINNNNSFRTGYQANNEPTCGYTGTNEECNTYCNDGTCNTSYPNSVLASTTGNISGIYDMSGGAYEAVMGVQIDSTGNLMSGQSFSANSGFNGIVADGTAISGYEWPEEKYYDLYENSESYYAYYNRILGDATGEIGPFMNVIYINQTRNIGSWYSDTSRFIGNNNPWFSHNALAYEGADAGIFAFYNFSGMTGNGTFRLILTPT